MTDKDALDLKDQPAQEQADPEESSDKADLDDMLQLVGGVSSQLRWGGLLLGIGTIGLGLYLSRDYGTAFLIGGVILGVMIGGGLLAGASLAPGTIRRQVERQERRSQRH